MDERAAVFEYPYRTGYEPDPHMGIATLSQRCLLQGVSRAMRCGMLLLASKPCKREETNSRQYLFSATQENYSGTHKG